MQITSRFTLALHMLACTAYFGQEMKGTGDFLAGSVGANPALVRKILSQLRRAGLVRIARGTGGVTLAKAAEAITLRDVYRAVEPAQEGALFRIHEHANPKCPVGRHMQALLGGRMLQLEQALEAQMQGQTLDMLMAELHEREREEAQ